MNERSQGQKGIRHAMSHGGRNQTPVLLFFEAIVKFYILLKTTRHNPQNMASKK